MSKTRRAGLLAAIITLVATLTLCLLCYRFDNKYTYPGAQPISGVLLVSEAELQEHPIRYLVREWEFYPSLALAPGQVAEYAGYKTYRSIGESTTLEMGRGTYRLNLMLPAEEHTYALELPEVFSACRLYIGGKCVLQMGNPDQTAYAESIANNMIFFSAAGPTEILLSAADRSGVYSGLVYPPAFGEARAVLAVRERALLVHSSAMLLAVLGALFALLFGLWEKRRRGVLFFFCCVCVFGMVGYPLFHNNGGTGFLPWYALEISCFYGLLFLGVLLQCELYGLSVSNSLLLAAPCAAGLAAAVIRVTFAAHLPEAAQNAFSLLSSGLKYYTGGCMLMLSIWALLRGKKYSTPLLCASASLGVCLLVDRFLPLYEPVVGGWFGEIGGLILTATLPAIMCADAIGAFRFRLVYETEYQQMEKHLSLQRDHYRQLSQQIERSRAATHDLRHHLRALRVLAQQGQLEKIRTYLDEYEPHLAQQEITTFSDHPTADAVLYHYAAKAKELGAVYDVRLPIPADLAFPDDELCILLGNLLENAMEAMAKQTIGPRRLYLRGSAADKRLGLVIDNTYSGELSYLDGQYQSTKRPGPGIGLSSVRTIVEKYGGLVDFTADGSAFHVMLMIPLS